MWNNITSFIKNKDGDFAMKKVLKNLCILIWIFISSFLFTFFMRPERQVFDFVANKFGSNSKILIYLVLFFLFFCLFSYLAYLIYHIEFIKSIKPSTAIYFFLLSLTLVSCFKDNVNSIIIYRLLPKVEVEVSVNERTTIDIGSGDLRNGIAPDNFAIAEKYTDELFIKDFRMTIVPESYIKVGVNNEISKIYFSYDNIQYEYTVTSDDKARGEVKIYPFADSTRKVILSLVVYLFSAILVMIWMLWIHAYINTRETVPRIFEKKYTNKYVVFFVIFLICFSIALFQYVNKIHLPYYMPDNTVGDQASYWNTYIFKDGKIDIGVKIFPFRGYTNFLLSSISKFLGSRLSIDPVKIYLIFPAFAFAWLLSVIIPDLYICLTGKEPKLFSILLFSGIFIFFWAEYLTLVATDLYNNVLFFASITYAIKAYRKESIICAIISGTTLSLMVNMHYNFGIYIIVIAVGYPICIVTKNYKKNGVLLTVKEFVNRVLLKLKEIITKKRIVGFTLAVTCFLIVCVPQAQINYKSNYIGLFPHDTEDAYVGKPVSWSMWNTFLSYGMILWPKFIGDGQIMSMKTQLYEKRDELLHPAQCMDVYANSPVETAVTLIKKCFTMFDKKDNVNYGIAITWRETYGLVFSFFNYLILIIGLYVLLKNKKVSIPIKRLSWLIFFSSVCLKLVGHVEQRSSMTFFIILLIYFAYTFVGEILVDKDEYVELTKDNCLIKFVVFGELLCFTLSMALWS